MDQVKVKEIKFNLEKMTPIFVLEDGRVAEGDYAPDGLGWELNFKFKEEVTGNETMKIITVDCCEHCPLMETTWLAFHIPNTHICQHETIDGSEIENIKIIPDWCPLENFK